MKNIIFSLLVCTKVDPHFCIMKIDLAREYSSEYVKITAGGVVSKQGQQVDNSHQLKMAEVLQPKDLA